MEIRPRIDYVEGLSEAVGTIRANPLRASLAALAMAAAVATTSMTVTALNGLAAQARLTSARAFGADTFVIARVFGTTLSRRELAAKLERNPNLSRNDVRFLDRYAGARVLYSPVVQRSADVVSGGRTFENASVNGAGASLAIIREIGLDRGRFFTSDEDTRAAQVAVIGDDVARELFPASNPLGATIRLGGRAFTVLGVMARQGGAGGVSLDRYVWMPVRAFERIYGAPASLQVFARAADSTGAEATLLAEDRARATMRARRQLAPDETDNFDLLAPEAGRSFVAAITERAGAAAPPISAMALLAAIVVVANTTLVSVTERTREIGVRRALGATRDQVLFEVLAESALTALAGGVIGTGLAAGALAGAESAVGIPLVLTAATIAVSLGAATASGVLAGWYPARRAAAGAIVDALRAE